MLNAHSLNDRLGVRERLEGTDLKIISARQGKISARYIFHLRDVRVTAFSIERVTLDRIILGTRNIPKIRKRATMHFSCKK